MTLKSAPVALHELEDEGSAIEVVGVLVFGAEPRVLPVVEKFDEDDI